ncbi:MAG TPA: hypothetical protein VFQ58_10690, partial [Flavisolibacter sp.]|nr:hypothetical protein [Flavisolibacter sp.]
MSLQIHNHFSKRSILILTASLFLLSFISSYYFRVQPSINHQQKILQRYVTSEEIDAYKLLKDSALMHKLVLKNETLDEFSKIERKNYGIFLYAETTNNRDLIFWNNQSILPAVGDFNLQDGEYFQQLSNGYYIVLKESLKLNNVTNNITAFVLIPVVYQYYLETNYLPTHFAHNKDAISKISLSNTPTSYQIHSVQNNTFFYIKRVTHTNVAVSDSVTIVLRIVAILLLLVYFHLESENLVKRTRAIYGILLLTFSFILIRVILYAFPNIFSFRQFSLFDPTIYATNLLNR